MPETPPFDPNRTVAAIWRLQLAGTGSEERPHWRTKVAYYTATCEVIAAASVLPPTWQRIVAAVRPRGSRSTFYEVTGRNAKHPLMGAYLRAATTDALQIALTYRRRTAVDQLIDEAKVWAFWPYRQSWLEHAHPIRGHRAVTAAAGHVAALVEWARRNPRLAAVLDHAPPACAVEDIVAINRGRLPAMRAHTLLRHAIRDAIADTDEDDEEAEPTCAREPAAI